MLHSSRAAFFRRLSVYQEHQASGAGPRSRRSINEKLLTAKNAKVAKKSECKGQNKLTPAKKNQVLKDVRIARSQNGIEREENSPIVCALL
jgi:hypothetical protein